MKHRIEMFDQLLMLVTGSLPKDTDPAVRPK